MSVLNPIYQTKKTKQPIHFWCRHIDGKGQHAPEGRIYNETLDASYYLLDVYYDDFWDFDNLRYQLCMYDICKIGEIGGREACTNILRELVAEEKQSARCNNYYNLYLIFAIDAFPCKASV